LWRALKGRQNVEAPGSGFYVARNGPILAPFRARRIKT
jgi:hypothetical protein